MAADAIPVAPLSIWNPVHLGTDELGNRVEVTWPSGTCSSAASLAAASPLPCS
jgi:hypothetical protein